MKTLKKLANVGYVIAGLILIAGAVLYVNTGTVFGLTGGHFVNNATGYTDNYNFFIATTTTATSTNNTIGDGSFKIAGAKRVVMYFSRGGVIQPNTGSTLFKVQVSPDGVNWYDYNRLLPNIATSTNSTGVADSDYKVGSVTITAATSTSINALDLRGFQFYSVRCIAVETTDGEHTCKATAEF